MINYYTLLGVTESASSSEIKAAFKRLALRYHPDKHQGESTMEEHFKEINHAYQVLSNPYEKARYDIQLKYGQSHSVTSTTYSHQSQSTYQAPSNPPRSKTYRKPSYSEPEIDWKENWRATAYAFGFTFIMAILVMSAITIKDYLDAEVLKEKLAERRIIFEQAQTAYRMGNVGDALNSINGLGSFMDTEKDMLDYKTGLYDSFVLAGENNYISGEYEEAIYYFELIEEYAARKPLILKEHLAKSYQRTFQPNKSLKMYKELLIEGYRSLEIYIDMARIHRDQLQDRKEARRYFEIANDQAIQRYEAIYGDAYPLVLTAKLLPPFHYDLYTELAEIYLQTGDAEKAVKATHWNINIWPDSAANYAIAAEGYQQMRRFRKACDNYAVARSLGYSKPLAITCP